MWADGVEETLSSADILQSPNIEVLPDMCAGAQRRGGGRAGTPPPKLH